MLHNISNWTTFLVSDFGLVTELKEGREGGGGGGGGGEGKEKSSSGGRRGRSEKGGRTKD